MAVKLFDSGKGEYKIDIESKLILLLELHLHGTLITMETFGGES